MSQVERVPRVRVKNRGRVTESMQRIAEAYKKVSGNECRWIYDPVNRPELSGVISRQADGYEKVFGRDLQDKEMLRTLGIAEDQAVRFADTTLMGIPSAQRKELKQEVLDATDAQIRSIDRNFYDEIHAIDKGDGGKELTDGQRPRPRGRSVIEEKEYKFEYTQKTGGDE